jgi:ABC-type Fe3+-hydroxamate transport system substrate-binding protein
VQARFFAPRGALLALLAAAAAVTVAGCQESGFDESKETVRPLKVQHVLGETKVPGQAKDPLTLTLDSLDDTLALKVHPARAAVPGERLPEYLRARGAGVPLMRPVGATDLAAVEAVHPDLILGAAGTDGRSGQGHLYDRLSRIAPTVMIALGGGQWKLNVRQVGEALGRTNDSEQLLIDYDREAALARRAIAAADGGGSAKPRVAVALATADGIRFAKRNSFAGTILADAGVKQVHTAAGADVTLLARAPGATGHVDGRVVRIDAALWLGPGGSLAAKAALNDLRQALAG